MNKTERIQAYCLSDSPDVECCGNCNHFYLHYTCCNGEFSQTFSGHCVHPRMKMRQVWDVCDKFQMKTLDPQVKEGQNEKANKNTDTRHQG